MILWVLPVKLISGECHNTSQMNNQIGFGNALVLSGNNTLFELRSTQIYVVKWRHYDGVSYNKTIVVDHNELSLLYFTLVKKTPYISNKHQQALLSTELKPYRQSSHWKRISSMRSLSEMNRQSISAALRYCVNALVIFIELLPSH